MPRRKSPNEKGPSGLGSDRTGAKKVGTPSVAVRRSVGKLQPPRDPVLRAIWKVRQADDLTPTQQLALLSLWRLLHSGPKQIGAGLLAALIGVSKGGGKNIFSVLQQKGYIKSNGKFRDGRQDRAWRELTGKLGLPREPSTTAPRSSSSDQRRAGVRSSSGDPDRSSSSDIDQGVRHTRGRCGSDDPPASESGNRDDHPREERTISIADLIAVNDPVKSKSGGGAA